MHNFLKVPLVKKHLLEAIQKLGKIELFSNEKDNSGKYFESKFSQFDNQSQLTIFFVTPTLIS